MKLLRNLLTIALVIGAAAIGVLFALQNETPVALDVLVYTFEPRSLALWILMVLILTRLINLPLLYHLENDSRDQIQICPYYSIY